MRIFLTALDSSIALDVKVNTLLHSIHLPPSQAMAFVTLPNEAECLCEIASPRSAGVQHSIYQSSLKKDGWVGVYLNRISVHRVERDNNPYPTSFFIPEMV